MGEPSRKIPRSLVRCRYCGTEQVEISVEGGSFCIKCGRPLVTAPAPPQNESGSAVIEVRRPPPRPRLAESSRMKSAVSELIAAGPVDEGGKAAHEVVALQKRGASILGVLPLIGPWLVRDNEALDTSERRKVAAVSILLTLAIAGAIWMSLPTEADHLVSLHRRIESNMQTLAGIADSYRKDHGTYPDVTTWKKLAARGDARFFDPWARPYLYAPESREIEIRTLGRDGVPGGEFEDADVAREFGSAGPGRETH